MNLTEAILESVAAGSVLRAGSSTEKVTQSLQTKLPGDITSQHRQTRAMTARTSGTGGLTARVENPKGNGQFED